MAVDDFRLSSYRSALELIILNGRLMILRKSQKDSGWMSASSGLGGSDKDN